MSNINIQVRLDINKQQQEQNKLLQQTIKKSQRRRWTKQLWWILSVTSNSCRTVASIPTSWWLCTDTLITQSSTAADDNQWLSQWPPIADRKKNATSSKSIIKWYKGHKSRRGIIKGVSVLCMVFLFKSTVVFFTRNRFQKMSLCNKRVFSKLLWQV